MKCGDCGQEVGDIAAIKRHKKEDCPALVKGQDNVDPGAPVEGGAAGVVDSTEAKNQSGEPSDKEKLDTIHNYARSLGLEFVLVDPERDKTVENPEAPKTTSEPTIDVSHLPKDTLAGLHRGAELRFEVMGWLEKDRDVLHVNDVRYPRRGR